MTEFVAFTDIQFQYNYPKSYIMEDGATSWFNEQLNIVDSIFNYCYDNSVKIVFFLGDLFQSKSNISVPLYNRVWELFYKHSRNLFIVMNTGNHDVYSKYESSLKPFSMITKIVANPTNLSLDEGTYARIIPFGRTSGNIGIPQSTNQINILFLHENIAGLKVGAMDYTLTSPLKQQLFGDWDFVFAGHIHKPQTIKNIINIGSPMIQDWAEADDKKRFIHYKNGEVVSIPIDCPRFIQFNKLTDKVRNKIENNNRDYFRIDVESSFVGDPIFKRWNCFYNLIKSKKREVRLRQEMSSDEELKRYIEIKNPKLDHDRLFEIGKEIINAGNTRP